MNDELKNISTARLSTDKWMRGGLLATVVYGVTILFFIGSRIPAFLWLGDLNNIGDFLAGVFAPLAFLWLFIGIRVQSLELRIQAEELAKNVQHQQDIAAATSQALSEHVPNFWIQTVVIKSIQYYVKRPGENGQLTHAQIDVSELESFKQLIETTDDHELTGTIQFNLEFPMTNFGGTARSFVVSVNRPEHVPPNTAYNAHFERKSLVHNQTEEFRNSFTIEEERTEGYHFHITIFGYDGLNRFFRQDYKSGSQVNVDKTGFGFMVSPWTPPEELLNEMKAIDNEYNKSV